jgi:septal ring factor EnvC (AmiA/AmiB activator)
MATKTADKNTDTNTGASVDVKALEHRIEELVQQNATLKAHAEGVTEANNALKSENAELHAQLEPLRAANDDLKAKCEQLEDDYSETAESLTTQLENATKALETLYKENDALKSKAITISTGKPPDKARKHTDPVEIRGEKYIIRLATMRIKGEVITATDLAASPDLLAELVAKGSPILQKV